MGKIKKENCSLGFLMDGCNDEEGNKMIFGMIDRILAHK